MVRPWPDGADEGAEVTVPAGKLVVMGDNRNDSNDSRRWGRYGPGDTFTPDPFLPAENVEGKVILRFAPLRRMGHAGLE